MKKFEKKTILIFRELTKKEKIDLNNIKDTLIYVLEGNTEKYEFDFKKINKPKNLENLWKNELLDFTKIDVENKNILEYFSGSNPLLNVWFYHKFRLYFDKINVYFEIKTIQDFLEKSENLTIYSNHIKEHWFSKKISIKRSKVQNSKPRKRGYFKIIKLFLSRVYLSKKSIKNETRPYVLYNYLKNYSWTEKNKDLVFNNKVWAKLHDDNRNQFCLIEESDLFIKKNDEDFSKQNYQTLSKDTFTKEYLIFRFLICPFNLFSLKKDFSIYTKNLKTLKSTLQNPIQLMIVDFYWALHKSSLLYFVKFFSFQYFFSKNSKFKAAISHSENTSSGKIVLDAAKSLSMKTFGVQHASINQQNIAYNFSKNEQKHFACPDYTLAWGQATKEILQQYGHYKESQILITGQLRTDAIQNYKNINNNCTIGFFTQAQPDNTERILAAKVIIENVSKRKDMRLIIKVHPNENPELYQNLKKSFKADNVEILENQKSLYQILSEISYAITCYSTVGIEALLFDRPLIVFDSKEVDKANFIKDKIAYLVKNEKDFNAILDRIESKSLMIKKESIRYIRDNFLKIDGASSQRALHFIQSKSK